MIYTIHTIICDTCGRSIDNEGWQTLPELKRCVRGNGWRFARNGDVTCGDCIITAHAEMLARNGGVQGSAR